MTYHIYYAVIALTIEEVEDVISSLNERGLTELSQWLADHKGEIYGNLPDKWKPFDDQTISDIIEDKSNCYICETPTIFQLHEDCRNTRIIRSIDVFFIDVFTMYIEKYKNLASRVDHSFMDASDSKCCFVINYTLPANHQEELEKECTNIWNEVLEGYEEGFLHRVAARVNDLKNFKNFVKRSLENEERPSPKGKMEMKKYYQDHNIQTDDKYKPGFR